MITTVQSYLQRLQVGLRRWLLDPVIHRRLKLLTMGAAGFVLSAASLAHQCQPFVLGLLCALQGLNALPVALGGALGYRLFWGSAATEAILWCAAGLLLAATVGRSLTAGRTPWLMAALAGLTASLTGLWMQYGGSSASLPVYLLRIALAMGSTRLFSLCLAQRDRITDWLAMAVGVLALCQLAPTRWLCPGLCATALLAVGNAFPAAALAGLAVDLSQVTPVPMTAAMSLAWLVRLLPGKRRWQRSLAPAVAYCVVMSLTESWDLYPLPALVLGGLLGQLLPKVSGNAHRRGETGVAQVRLEMTAEVYRQMQQLLLELDDPAVDQQALLLRACERACGSCSCRKSCTGREQARRLSPQLLTLPILDSTLPFSCRRTGRLLQELRRAQEQFRLLQSLHRQRTESRQALMQQYSFLCRHLQALSDGLAHPAGSLELRFEPEVVFGASPALPDNGDRCLQFAGTAGRYYVTVLDGMGTGIGAADEAVQAGLLLKRLLCAGFPVEHALSTLNSLCALRGRGGAVTVDLVELELTSGRACLYKWGAPAAFLLRGGSHEKIGTAGPPPGLFVADSPEAAQRLSLRRGEILLLLSDGVSGEAALEAATAEEPLHDRAARILSSSCGEHADDATVALIRLRPRELSA